MKFYSPFVQYLLGPEQTILLARTQDPDVAAVLLHRAAQALEKLKVPPATFAASWRQRCYSFLAKHAECETASDRATRLAAGETWEACHRIRRDLQLSDDEIYQKEQNRRVYRLQLAQAVHRAALAARQQKEKHSAAKEQARRLAAIMAVRTVPTAWLRELDKLPASAEHLRQLALGLLRVFPYPKHLWCFEVDTLGASWQLAAINGAGGIRADSTTHGYLCSCVHAGDYETISVHDVLNWLKCWAAVPSPKENHDED